MKKFLMFIIISFMIINHPLKGQTSRWKNYIYGSDKITSIIEDGDYLWIGTDVGIIKLNKNFQVKNNYLTELMVYHSL